MKTKKFFTFMMSLISLLFVGSLSFTFAAFINSQNFKQNYIIKLNYSDMFDSIDGDGAYVISTPNSLKNLSSLVSAGCVNFGDKFVLGADINWTASDGELSPIGNMHNPFRATFDGKGYKISNIKVNGHDTADNGLFGYISTSGVVKNLILINPTIIGSSSYANASSWNYDYSKNNVDKNLLRDFYDRTFLEKIIITPTINNYVISDYTIKVPVKNSATFPKIKSISDYSFITSIEHNKSAVTEEVINSETYKVVKITPTFDPKIVKNISFSTEICVSACVEINPGEIRICNFTLENIQFHVNKDGQITNKYEKLLNPATKSFGNVYTQNTHIIYAGLICGTLDGTLDHIVVYDGKIRMDSRPFHSDSVLIGHHIADESDSKVSKEHLNIDDVTNEGYKYANANMYGKDNNGNYYANTDQNIGNRFLAGIYKTDDPSDANKLLLNKNTEDIIRFYDTNSGTNNAGSDANSSSLRPHHVKFVKHNKGKAIRFDDDIETKIFNTKRSWSNGWGNILISNALHLWTTDFSADSFLNKLFGSTTKNIVLRLAMSFYFYDSNACEVDSATKEIKDKPIKDSTSKIKIYVTKKQPKPEGNTEVYAGELADAFDGPSDSSFVYPDHETWVTNKGLRYPPNMPDNFWESNHKKHIYHTPYFLDLVKVPNQPNAIKYGLVKTNDLERAYDENNGGISLNHDPSVDPLAFKKDEISGKVGSPKEKLVEKLIDIEFSKDFLGDQGVFNTANRTPLILIGIESPSSSYYQKPTFSEPNLIGARTMDTSTEKPRVPGGNYAFDLVKLDITISDEAGNTSGKLLSVDFGKGDGSDVNNIPTFDKATNTWSSSYSELVDNDYKAVVEMFKIESNAANTPITIVGEGENSNKYNLRVYRNTSGTLNAEYNIVGVTNQAGLIPFSSPGFTRITVTENKNLNIS